MMDPKRQEEERKRIIQKYGTRQREPAFNPNTSRYMQYRNKENLIKERAEHPEKFIEKKEPVIESISEPRMELIEEPQKKKSWFSKLFKK